MPDDDQYLDDIRGFYRRFLRKHGDSTDVRERFVDEVELATRRLEEQIRGEKERAKKIVGER